MYKAVLVKVESTHNNLRTKDVDGYCLDLPQKGDQFLLFAEPLEEKLAEFRLIHTTEVKEIDHVIEGKDFGQINFKTKNSTYELHYVEKEDEYYKEKAKNFKRLNDNNDQL